MKIKLLMLFVSLVLTAFGSYDVSHGRPLWGGVALWLAGGNFALSLSLAPRRKEVISVGRSDWPKATHGGKDQ